MWPTVTPEVCGREDLGVRRCDGAGLLRLRGEALVRGGAGTGRAPRTGYRSESPAALASARASAARCSTFFARAS
ncbi:hypothetical protein, partial [Streptomyces sp. SID3212]|uniref:hypothetical protein n=1 Tax=Streptomyces sp. SID3212 TaxID=2690259 RepID=UPI001F162406